MSTSVALALLNGIPRTQTIAASASSLPVPTIQVFNQASYITVTVSSANATAGAAYFDGSLNWVVVYTIVAGSTLILSSPNPGQTGLGSSTLTKTGGTGDATIGALSVVSNGTYQAPTSPVPLYLKVIMIGGGSGGSGGGTAPTGSTGGGNTTFGLSTASGASAVSGGSGGIGGGVAVPNVIGVGAIGISMQGSPGCGEQLNPGSTDYLGGGSGGSSFLGGGGTSNVASNTYNSAAFASGGGGGGGPSGPGGGYCGSGGGGGGGLDLLIVSPSSTYSFTIGAGGAGGAGSVSTGGPGAQGQIIVYEFYGPLGTATGTSAIRTITSSSGSLSSADDFIVVDFSGTCNLTLPSSVAGQVFNVKNINSSGTIIITPTSGTIDGSSTLTITGIYNSVEIVGDGTNYWNY